MDYIFNNFIPRSEENKIIIRPTSKTFINGIAQSYDTTYPEELKDYISEREYSYMMNKIMDELMMMWPCCFCFTYGYLFCLCTLGLSFILPNCCISEAKIKLIESINEANDLILKNKNLQLSYHQKCSTSWLQIDILEKHSFSKIVGAPETKSYLIKNQLY